MQSKKGREYGYAKLLLLNKFLPTTSPKPLSHLVPLCLLKPIIQADPDFVPPKIFAIYGIYNRLKDIPSPPFSWYPLVSLNQSY